MINIRLHGTEEEIRKAEAAIEERFNVLTFSHLYKDRGKSVYYRAYIDAEPKAEYAKTRAVVAAELEKSKMFQGLVCCDRDEGKRDCIDCPYYSEKECIKSLMLDFGNYLTGQKKKELTQAVEQ